MRAKTRRLPSNATTARGSRFRTRGFEAERREATHTAAVPMGFDFGRAEVPASFDDPVETSLLQRNANLTSGGDRVALLQGSAQVVTSARLESEIAKLDAGLPEPTSEFATEVVQARNVKTCAKLEKEIGKKQVADKYVEILRELALDGDSLVRETSGDIWYYALSGDFRLALDTSTGQLGLYQHSGRGPRGGGYVAVVPVSKADTETDAGDLADTWE